MRLATEVRELKVELRKAETERARAQERLESTERERAQLEEQLSRLDIERATAVQSKGTIDAARARLEEKLAKSEAARAKAEEALAAANQGREAAAQAADRAKLDADREHKRAAELQLELERTHQAIHGATPQMLAEAAHPQLLESTSEVAIPTEARVQLLEEEIARLEKQLAAHAGGGGGVTAANGVHLAQLTEIKKKARRGVQRHQRRAQRAAGPTSCWPRIWSPSMARRSRTTRRRARSKTPSTSRWIAPRTPRASCERCDKLSRVSP